MNCIGTPTERLERRLVRRPWGCLEWTGSRLPKGYGQIKVNGKMMRTHRLAWSLANDAPVPEGMCILHSCDNPPCCEPTHLRLGTQAENNADMTAKGRGVNIAAQLNAAKTHCLRGHPYDEVNTYVGPGGHRDCRTCNRAASARYKEQLTAIEVA